MITRCIANDCTELTARVSKLCDKHDAKHVQRCAKALLNRFSSAIERNQGESVERSTQTAQ